MAFVFNPLDVAGITGPTPPAPSASIVQALLKRHGVAPKAPAGGDGPSIAPASMPSPSLGDVPVNLPDVSSPAPLSFDQGADSANTLNAAAHASDIAPAHGGMLSRIGDFLKSDEGRATMLRFAAGAFNGGFGGGLTAATNFADQRRAAAAAAAQQAFENGLHQQHEMNSYNLGLGRLGIDAANSAETGRHNRASEGNDVYRTKADMYKHDTPSGDALVQSADRRFIHITPSGDTQVTQQGENYRHDTPSGDTQVTQANENLRHSTPSGDKVLDIRAQTAPKVNVHAHYTTTPEEYQQNGPRLKPSMVKPNMPGSSNAAVTTIASDAEYNALPSGTKFQGPDGVVRIKP